MPEEITDQNKIEVLKDGEFHLERARSPLARVQQMEKPPDLLAFWRLIRKRRWTILTAFSLLFAIVVVGTLKEKPVYRATALIEIEKENPSLVNPQELFQLDEVSDAYLETQYKVLESEDLADRVIAQLGLDHVAEFQPQARSWPWSKDANLSAQLASATESPAVPNPAMQEAVRTRFSGTAQHQTGPAQPRG
jgi:uncharacterized protein involved in exopolysaccharide biosynthesis